MPSIDYPQYRKYPNEKGYFKVISDKEWEEIQVIGSKYLLHRFIVSILPDRNFIYDMTFDYESSWVKISEEEYEAVKDKTSA
ncbi:MAG: hypothetical protein JWO44_677 [Bacteroidetes bacterium]|nr:hypothetical protein [Bacteroidota bacterium]